MEVAKAMASISTADVNQWLVKNVGESLLAQRIDMLDSEEQKIL